MSLSRTIDDRVNIYFNSNLGVITIVTVICYVKSIILVVNIIWYFYFVIMIIIFMYTVYHFR